MTVRCFILRSLEEGTSREMYIWRNTEVRANLRTLTLLRWSYILTYWYHTFCCCWRMYIENFAIITYYKWRVAAEGWHPRRLAEDTLYPLQSTSGLPGTFSPDVSSFWDIKCTSGRTFSKDTLSRFLAIASATKKRNDNNSDLLRLMGEELGFFMCRVEDSNSHENAFHY
jgi:hypothetical protein